jgi:hypothetical protein
MARNRWRLKALVILASIFYNRPYRIIKENTKVIIFYNPLLSFSLVLHLLWAHPSPSPPPHLLMITSLIINQQVLWASYEARTRGLSSAPSCERIHNPRACESSTLTLPTLVNSFPRTLSLWALSLPGLAPLTHLHWAHPNPNLHTPKLITIH